MGLTFPPGHLDAKAGITMQEAEIQDYARQLLDAHGDKALAEAAQKARSFEEKGNAGEARTWRRIEAAIKIMRGPHES
jgi:regulator of protease activity HflC (stomatin/prohibitin superfamily)